MAVVPLTYGDRATGDGYMAVDNLVRRVSAA